MKITRIAIKDFGGSRQIDIDIKNKVSLIHGMNSQGKSWTFKAIKAALTGDINGIMKKDYKLLSLKGYCAIKLDDDSKLSFHVPSGKNESLDNEFIPLCIEGSKFTELSEKDKLLIINRLIGSNIIPAEVQDEIKAIGVECSELDKAQDLIKAKLSEFRSAWKFLSGSDYGKNKAVEIIGKERSCQLTIEDLEGANKNFQVKINNLHEKKGKIFQEIPEEKKIELEESCNNKERLTSALANAIASKAEIKERYRATQLTLKPYIEYDAAKKQKSYTCPSCGGNGIYLKDDKLVHFDEFNNLDISLYLGLQEQLSDIQKEGEAASLTEKEIILQLQNCSAADNILKMHKSLQSVSKEYLDKIDNEITKTNNAINENILAINEIRDQEKNKQLYEIHEKISNLSELNEKIEKEVVPKLSANAVEKFIMELRKINLAFGSNNVNVPLISNDLDGFYFNAMPLALLSESDLWKINVITSIAFALLSEIKLIMVDRLDILVPKDRLGFLKTLNDLGLNNAICFMSVNEKIKSLPDYIDSFYIENGVIND